MSHDPALPCDSPTVSVCAFGLATHDVPVSKLDCVPYLRGLHDFRVANDQPISADCPLALNLPEDIAQAVIAPLPDPRLFAELYLAGIASHPLIDCYAPLLRHPTAAVAYVAALEAIADFTRDDVLLDTAPAMRASLRAHALTSSTPFLECKWAQNPHTHLAALQVADILESGFVRDVATAVHTIYARCSMENAVIFLHELEARVQCLRDRDAYAMTAPAFHSAFASPATEETLAGAIPFAPDPYMPTKSIAPMLKPPVPPADAYRDMSVGVARQLMYGIDLRDCIPPLDNPARDPALHRTAVVAGGFLLRALMLPHTPLAQRHGKVWPYRRSDCDIYLVGAWTHAAALQFAATFYAALAGVEGIAVDPVFVSANALTISCRCADGGALPADAPHARDFQIMLTTYRTIPELLFTFDLDPCAFAFDGAHLYSLPRARRAIAMGYMTGFVHPSFGRDPQLDPRRVAKYSARGFTFVDYFHNTHVAEVRDLIKRAHIDNRVYWREIMHAPYPLDRTQRNVVGRVGPPQAAWTQFCAFWLRETLGKVATDADGTRALLRGFAEKPDSTRGDEQHGFPPIDTITYGGYFLDNPWDGVSTAATEIGDDVLAEGRRLARFRCKRLKHASSLLADVCDADAWYCSTAPKPTGGQLLLWKEYVPRGAVWAM